VKKILVLFVCLSALLLSTTCTEASVEVYYDGMFAGKYGMDVTGSIGFFELESDKHETDLSLHTFGGRLNLSEILVIGAELGVGEIKKSSEIEPQDLQTTSFIAGLRFDLNELVLNPFVSVDTLSAEQTTFESETEVSGTFLGIGGKIPLNDQVSIEGFYKFSIYTSCKIDGEDVSDFHKKTYGQYYDGSNIGLSSFSVKANCLVTENIALVLGYKKYTIKQEVDLYAAGISGEIEMRETLDSIVFGASILF